MALRRHVGLLIVLGVACSQPPVDSDPGAPIGDDDPPPAPIDAARPPVSPRPAEPEAPAPSPDAPPSSTGSPPPRDERDAASPTGSEPDADRQDAGAARDAREPGGGPDAPSAAKGPPCPAGLAFCSSFEEHEEGKLPGAPWKLASGRVQVDGKHAFSGKKAVLVTGKGGITPVVGDWPKDKLYGRMMMYAESLTTGGHSILVAASGAGEANLCCSRMRFGKYGTGYWNETSLHSCDGARNSRTAIPRNRWFCYEFMLDSATGGWGVWVDGAPVPELTHTKTGGGCFTVSPVRSLRIGYEHYHASSGTLALWIDDVALSDRRVGCPASATAH
jgi:hypothetical protein